MRSRNAVSGLGQGFSNLNVHVNKQNFIKNADSDPLALEWGLRFCISNELLGDSSDAGPCTTL